MLKLSKPALNVLIILALAAAIDLLPGGGTAANTVIEAISLAFLGLLAWMAARLYREHRVELYSLGTRWRAILYGALAVGALTLTASGRLTETPGGTVALIVLLGACVYALVAVYRANRQY